MTISYFCPGWGSANVASDEFFQKVKNAGYDGIEYGIARDLPQAEIASVFELAKAYELKVIAQHYDTSESDFDTHYTAYAAWLKKMEDFTPFKINSQTGRDIFSFGQNSKLIALADAYTLRTGIDVYHETHRGKALFAAHISRQYLEELPDLQLTLDASHWVNVAESLLEDQQDTMKLAISKTAHIHARVGYSEGPQVPDPRMAEYKHALDAHLRWWDSVVQQKTRSELTIAPEFGPFPYMVASPLDGSPIASQWDINVFMLNLLKKRYS